MGFLVVTNLASDEILRTTFIGEIIEKICSKNGTVTPIASSPIAMEEIEPAATYTVNVTEGEIPAEEEYEFLCVTVWQGRILPMASHIGMSEQLHEAYSW